MSRTSTMMTRIIPLRPSSATDFEEAARDRAALHALRVLPR